jgi:ComF family protein
VFIPQSFSKWLSRGYNQSELLAQELGKLMQVPIKNYLKKEGAHLSQAKLSKNERAALPSSTFQLKKNSDIENKTVLLIDDVYTTGSTMKQAALALREGAPKNIYGFTIALVSKK